MHSPTRISDQAASAAVAFAATAASAVVVAFAVVVASAVAAASAVVGRARRILRAAGPARGACHCAWASAHPAASPAARVPALARSRAEEGRKDPAQAVGPAAAEAPAEGGHRAWEWAARAEGAGAVASA